MVVAEIDQEVAHSATVLTGRIIGQAGSQRLGGSPELESQWMLKGNVAGEFHDGKTGTGLMSCATALAYCW
jgi:hypothetical protein